MWDLQLAPLSRPSSGNLHVSHEGTQLLCEEENWPLGLGWYESNFQALPRKVLGRDLASLHTPSSLVQLGQYLPFYPLSQILLITAEELSQDRVETMTRIFGFLGVDQTFRSRKFSLELNPPSIKRDRSRLQLPTRRFLVMRPGRILPFRLGVSAQYRLPRATAPQAKDPILDADVEARLLEIFHDGAQRLRRLSGLKLKGWCV
jgi:hypothetical protein